MAAICSFPQFGKLNGLLLYSYFSLSLVLGLFWFCFPFPKRVQVISFFLFFGGGWGAQQIPALVEQASQAVTKLCPLLQGVIFFIFALIYSMCI